MCSYVDQGKHHAQNHEPNNHTQLSEVHVELHHLPNSDARPGRESEPGVSGDHVTAAGGDRLVGPHGSRDKRHRGLPQRFTPRERVSLQLQIADCSADQEILIEPRIDALKLRHVIRIEKFEVACTPPNCVSLSSTGAPAHTTSRIAALSRMYVT